jgi:hypothetical protein
VNSLPRSADEYRNWWEQTAPTPYGYCWCDCGEKTKIAPYSSRRLGWIAGEPTRYIKGHNNRRYDNWVAEDTGYDTACWIWRGRRDGSGYGQVYVDNKLVGIHRYMYRREGNRLADGEAVHHLCGVKLCCNPDHLRAMDPSKHQTLHSRGTKNPNHRIPLVVIDAIKILLRDGTLSQYEIALCFNIDTSTVSKIARGVGMYAHSLESYGDY